MVAAVQQKPKFPSPDYEANEAMLREVFAGQSDSEVTAAYQGAKLSMNLPYMFCCAHELHLREMERE